MTIKGYKTPKFVYKYFGIKKVKGDNVQNGNNIIKADIFFQRYWTKGTFISRTSEWEGEIFLSDR